MLIHVHFSWTATLVQPLYSLISHRNLIAVYYTIPESLFISKKLLSLFASEESSVERYLPLNLKPKPSLFYTLTGVCDLFGSAP